MSGPKMISEREAVLRERAACEYGMRHQFDSGYHCSRFTDVAKASYPLPKIERPRVERDPSGTRYGPASGVTGDLHWMAKNGRLRAVTRNGTIVPQWEDDQRHDSWPTSQRVALWASLLASPTELVDDDGAALSGTTGGDAT